MRRRDSKRIRDDCRAGLLAVSEIAVVVVTVVVLLFSGSWLTRVAGTPSEADQSAMRASVERPIYRLSLERPSGRIWVFKPGNEITLLNPSSGEVENSRDTCGHRLIDVSHSESGATTLLVSDTLSAMLYREGKPSLHMNVNLEPAQHCDVTVSKDGSLALTCLTDGTIRGWSVRDGEATSVNYTLRKDSPLARIALDRRGDRLFAAFGDGTVSIFETKFMRPMWGGPLKPKGICTAAEWSEDGQQIAVATDGGLINLIDAESGQPMWQSKLEDGKDLIRITAVALSPDGRRLAACGLSSQAVVWDLTSSTAARRLTGHDGLIRTLMFTAEGTSLFTGSFDGSIREWSMESFAQLKRFD